MQREIPCWYLLSVLATGHQTAKAACCHSTREKILPYRNYYSKVVAPVKLWPQILSWHFDWFCKVAWHHIIMNLKWTYHVSYSYIPSIWVILSLWLWYGNLNFLYSFAWRFQFLLGLLSNAKCHFCLAHRYLPTYRFARYILPLGDILGLNYPRAVYGSELAIEGIGRG